MHRFFVTPDAVKGNVVTITGDDVHHITRVLRLGRGDLISVLDGTGAEYEVAIAEVREGAVFGEIMRVAARASEPGAEITVVQGLPKGDKMDLVVQKCTEIGVRAIIPAVTARSVVRLDDDGRARRKAARWRRIAEEAAKQSGRGVIPEVRDIVSLREALETTVPAVDLAVIPWELENGTGLRQALESRPDARRFAVFIGPEGGFDLSEVEVARSAGAVPVSLGPRILRTETAALVVAAAILYHTGDLG